MSTSTTLLCVSTEWDPDGSRVEISHDYSASWLAAATYAPLDDADPLWDRLDAETPEGCPGPTAAVLADSLAELPAGTVIVWDAINASISPRIFVPRRDLVASAAGEILALDIDGAPAPIAEWARDWQGRLMPDAEHRGGDVWRELLAALGIAESDAAWTALGEEYARLAADEVEPEEWCPTCDGSGVVEEIPHARFHSEISWYGRHPADAVDVPCPDCGDES